MSKTPRVSVGLPVYNGSKYLASAIESVLSQTFTDLELVICDNASTDETEAICRRYQETDGRVRFHRNERNLGASPNFNRVLELSKGDLFRWLAADDLLEPTCIEECVGALDRNPSAILAHTDVRIIDEAGKIVLDYHYRPGHAASESAADRYRDVILLDRWCAELFALVRTDVLRTTRGLDRYIASDRILRAELALRGPYTTVPKLLFLNRDHPERSVRALPAHHLRAGWFDSSRAGRRVLPHWRIFFEYFRCIRRAPLSLKDRWRCYLRTPLWLGIHANSARLVADLMIAAIPVSGTALLRTSRAADKWLKSGP